MQGKDQELQEMLNREQRNQLSSEQQERQQLTSRTHYRKPIKHPFSDDSDDSDQDIVSHQTSTPFPPKQSDKRSVLQQVQGTIKWDMNQQIQINILERLSGQGMKEKTIRELASKYKALNVAYEKEKTQRKSLENQLNQTLKDSQKPSKSNQEEPQKNHIKSKQKCSNCLENEKKVCEFRLKSQNIKSELNKLGEDFDVDQALANQNGWKGRQQKIEKLKAKIKQLQQKLQNNGVTVSRISGFTQFTNNNAASFNTTRSSAMIAQNKRKQLQNLKIQVQGLRSQNQLLQGKVKSLTSRKLTLQSDIKELKSQFEKKRQVFIEKSENDDRFIQLLKGENEKLKKEERIITKIIYKDEEHTTALKQEIEVLKKRIKSLAISDRQNMPCNLQSAGKECSDPKPRVLSRQKKRQIEEEYLKSNKYLEKLSNEDEEQIYKRWKNSLKANDA